MQSSGCTFYCLPSSKRIGLFRQDEMTEVADGHYKLDAVFHLSQQEPTAGRQRDVGGHCNILHRKVYRDSSSHRRLGIILQPLDAAEIGLHAAGQDHENADCCRHRSVIMVCCSDLQIGLLHSWRQLRGVYSYPAREIPYKATDRSCFATQFQRHLAVSTLESRAELRNCPAVEDCLTINAANMSSPLNRSGKIPEEFLSAASQTAIAASSSVAVTL